jgi:ABC-2 type transport system permease protein
MTVVVQGSSRIEAIPRPKSVFQRNLNLTRELAITQFKLKYTGSALGYFWSMVKPLMLFGIMYLVFSVLLKAGRNTVNFPAQLLFAIVLWTFFIESTTSAMNAIAAASDLIRKAYFPRWILVVSSTASALLTFTINILLVMVVTLLLGQLHFGWGTLLAPLYIVQLAILVLGLSLLLSALFVFFRDLGHIWEILSLVLFYGSAVIFPITLLHGTLLNLAGLNPVGQIVEDIRHAMIDVPKVPSMVTLIGPLAIVPVVGTLAVLVIGFTVFNRLTPKFAEAL